MGRHKQTEEEWRRNFRYVPREERRERKAKLTMATMRPVGFDDAVKAPKVRSFDVFREDDNLYLRLTIKQGTFLIRLSETEVDDMMWCLHAARREQPPPSGRRVTSKKGAAKFQQPRWKGGAEDETVA